MQFTKWAYLDRQFYSGELEPVFQTYEMPLAMFATPGWDPVRIRDIRFVFEESPSGTIAVAGVGFAHSPGPRAERVRQSPLSAPTDDSHIQNSQAPPSTRGESFRERLEASSRAAMLDCIDGAAGREGT